MANEQLTRCRTCAHCRSVRKMKIPYRPVFDKITCHTENDCELDIFAHKEYAGLITDLLWYCPDYEENLPSIVKRLLDE